MTTTNIIKFLAHPVATKGGDTFIPPVDITRRIKSSSQIQISIDKNDFEAGIVNIPKLTLSVINEAGELDDGISPHPAPVFSFGRNKSRIEVKILEATLFDGDILDLNTAENPFDDQLNLTVTSPLNRLRQKVVASGDIHETATVAEALVSLCRNIPTIAAATFHGQNGDLAPFKGVNEHFLNRPAWDVIKKIAEITGNIALIGAGRTIEFYPSYAAEAFRPADPIHITDPMSVKITSGSKRVVNSVEINYSDGRIVQSNIASIAEHGERKKEFKAEWVKDRATAEILALNLVGTENSTPRNIIDIEHQFGNETLATLALLNRVELLVPEQYVGTPQGGDLALNADYAVVQRRGLKKRGRILAYKIDLKTLKVNLKIEESEWE